MWIKLDVEKVWDPEHVDRIASQLNGRHYRTEVENGCLMVEGGDALYRDIGNIDLNIDSKSQYQLRLVNKTTFEIIPCMKNVVIDVSSLSAGGKASVKQRLEEWDFTDTCVDEGHKLGLCTSQDRDAVAQFLSYLHRYKVTCSKGRDKRIYVRDHTVMGLTSDLKSWNL